MNYQHLVKSLYFCLFYGFIKYGRLWWKARFKNMLFPIKYYSRSAAERSCARVSVNVCILLNISWWMRSSSAAGWSVHVCARSCLQEAHLSAQQCCHMPRWGWRPQHTDLWFCGANRVAAEELLTSCMEEALLVLSSLWHVIRWRHWQVWRSRMQREGCRTSEALGVN